MIAATTINSCCKVGTIPCPENDSFFKLKINEQVFHSIKNGYHNYFIMYIFSKDLKIIDSIKYIEFNNGEYQMESLLGEKYRTLSEYIFLIHNKYLDVNDTLKNISYNKVSFEFDGSTCGRSDPKQVCSKLQNLKYTVNNRDVKDSSIVLINIKL